MSEIPSSLFVANFVLAQQREVEPLQRISAQYRAQFAIEIVRSAKRLNAVNETFHQKRGFRSKNSMKPF